VALGACGTADETSGRLGLGLGAGLPGGFGGGSGRLVASLTPDQTERGEHRGQAGDRADPSSASIHKRFKTKLLRN
jgi:hypothetical protein